MIDLSIPSFITLVIAYVYWGYWFFLTTVYLFKRTKNTVYDDDDPPHFVSIVIPASNEEAVITDVVQDCLRQTHKDLEVIVVAHNCSDKTVERALEVGDKRLKVLIFRTKEWGKGISLNYGLKHCKGDVVFTFDADAKFDSDFVEKMLRWIDRGYDAVQAKIIGKNQDYNLLTYLAHMESLLFSSIFCGAKSKLNMNAIIGGTGAAFKIKALELVGYFRNVLSEDLDIYLRLTRANYRIAYAEDCIVNDEKPSTLKAFFRQRGRWLAGHITVMMKQSLKEDLRMLRKDPLNFIYLFTPVVLACYWLHIILSIVVLLLNAMSINAFFIYGPVSIWILSIIIMALLYIMVLRRQKPFYSKKMLKLFPLFLFYNLYGYISFWKAFTISKSWEHTKTEHGFS